jgi:hypothetical protein
MARILRTQDYNFKTKKPILWRLWVYLIIWMNTNKSKIFIIELNI